MPAVILIAAAVTGAWMIAGKALSYALARGISVLGDYYSKSGQMADAYKDTHGTDGQFPGNPPGTVHGHG